MTRSLPDSLLELDAARAGFDEPSASDGGWQPFASTLTALRVWLRATEHGVLVAAFSRRAVADALAQEFVGESASTALPEGAASARSVGDRAKLVAMLQRAFRLSLSLPVDALADFESKTATMPRGTEVERMVIQRVGQQLFRDALLDYWGGACAVTGLAVPALLRASHIKPWADCERDAERLDVFNGLLLSPTLDALFDGGFVTILDDGSMRVSATLDANARSLLGLAAPLRLCRLEVGHRGYLTWHRAYVFERRDAHSVLPR